MVRGFYIVVIVLLCAFKGDCVDEVLTDTIGYGVSKEDWRFEVEQISWTPRAFYIRNLLTDEECEHLIKLATPTMEKSSVVDSDTGKSVPSEVRTSTGTFLGKDQDEIVSSIEERISRVTMLPISHQEGLQILRYVDGQKYEPHHDFFHDKVNQDPSNGGQRVVTVLMYLTDVEEGGETVFPDAATKVTGPGWSPCALKGLAVHPVSPCVYSRKLNENCQKRGNALMFYSLSPNGEEDFQSLHGSCPTLKGVKWSATKWIHVLPVGGEPGSYLTKPKHCMDVYEECPEVAKKGRCLEDQQTREKYCRKSCNSCNF